jgi:hypothetical protein
MVAFERERCQTAQTKNSVRRFAFSTDSAPRQGPRVSQLGSFTYHLTHQGASALSWFDISPFFIRKKIPDCFYSLALIWLSTRVRKFGSLPNSLCHMWIYYRACYFASIFWFGGDTSFLFLVFVWRRNFVRKLVCFQLSSFSFKNTGAPDLY